MVPAGFYNNLIKPIRDRRINDLIRGVDHSLLSPWDRELNFTERLRPISRFRDLLVTWAGDQLEGLADFPHHYVVNGNTEYLNHVIGFGKGTVGWKSGDYSYYPHIARTMGRSFRDLDSPGQVDEMITSWPGYSNGDAAELDFALSCTAARRHLDVAYLGLTRPISVDLSPFSTVGISLSKSLSIPFNRVAMVFSREEIPTLSMMNRIGYVNLSGVNLACHLLESIEPGYMWDTYGSTYQEEMSRNGLRATNCILVAYDQKGGRIGTAPFMNRVLDV